MKACFYKGDITGPGGQRHSFKHPESDFEDMTIDEVKQNIWESEFPIFCDKYPSVDESDVSFTCELVEV